MVRGDLAAGRGPLHHRVEGGQFGVDQGLAQGGLERLVTEYGVPEGLRQAGVAARGAGRDPGRLAQVARQGARVHRGEGAAPGGAQGGGHQLGLGLPLPVERGLAAAGPSGDALHGQGLVAVLSQLLQDGVVELLLTLRGDLGAARGGRRRRHGLRLSSGAPRLRVPLRSVRERDRIGTPAYRYANVSIHWRVAVRATGRETGG